jgi:hypothetical protein
MERYGEMATDVKSTRPVARPEEPVKVETTPTTAVNPSGVNGVAVYDRGPDATTSPSVYPSESMTQDPTPVEARSSSTLIAWIIGIVILVILAYLLWQFVF